MNDIKISPKHGVNPCIPICFFCGNEKNEVALLGRIDEEDNPAPSSAILDYIPCPECQKKMELGCTIIETTDEHTDFPVLGDDGKEHYLTGFWCVMKETSAKDIFREHYAKKLYVNKEILNQILPERKEKTNE